MSFVLYGVSYFDSKLLSVLMRAAAAALPPDLCCVLLFLWSEGLTERAIGLAGKTGRGVRGIQVVVGVHPIHAEVRSTSDSDPLKPNEALGKKKTPPST
jgi:hypothetical protein